MLCMSSHKQVCESQCPKKRLYNYRGIESHVIIICTENECEIDNGGCEHLCKDTLFSYECSCRDGYTLNQDNHACNGI